MRNVTVSDRKRLIIVIVFLFSIFICLGIFLLNKDRVSEKSINDSLTEYSTFKRDGVVTSFNFNTVGIEKIRTSKKSGKEAAYEVFSQGIKGLDGIELFPEGFSKSVELSREEQNGVSSKMNLRQHYHFAQKVNGIPIFGANTSVHIRNGNEIYGLQGKIITSNEMTTSKISPDKLRELALIKALEEVAEENKFIATILPEVIINKKLLGIDQDETNYRTTPILVSSEDVLFSKTYYVDQESGEIIYSDTNISDQLNRSIYNCSGGSCIQSRLEGGLAVSDADTNEMYDNLGLTYNYYMNTFSRDSYDNSGALLRANVHYPFSKPNAAWDGTSRQMYFYVGLSKRDVVGHELTHAITQYTAGLPNRAQSGALNESFSDIFGSAIDGNWLIGEEVHVPSLSNPLRSMSDPPARNQPDRLFASNYYCAGLPNSCDPSANDNCGVHTNSGVLNKAFFLMTDGGSFNGCSINGIGRVRSHAIMYLTLTSYLHGSANIKDAYSSILTACDDLYISDPGVCDEVKKALQATEMDQQPDGTQVSPVCSDTVPQAPACSGTGTGPTIAITPFPTGSTGGGGGGGTPGNYKVSGKVYIDVNNDAKFDSGDSPYKDAVLDLSDGPKSGSATTNAAGDYTLLDYPSGLYTITLSILGSKKETRPIVLGPDQSIDFRIFSTKTEPTIVAKPTVKVGPTIGDGPTLTPTPVPHICEFDPKCAAQKKNLQLCKLICRPKT